MAEDKIKEILQDEARIQGMTTEDWDAFESAYGENMYADLFYHLTRQNLEVEAAKSCWLGVLQHHEQLSRALSRKVGLRVALCDYITNIKPIVDNPIIIDMHKLLQQERHAVVDELTGLYNRRFFNQIINQEIRNSVRFKEAFSLLIMDIDDFKKYNDTFGHTAGDKLLADLSALICYTARDIDYVVRYGGEEFAVILPRVDGDYAGMVAERHRTAIYNHTFEYGPSLPSGKVTVSIGVATFPRDGVDFNELIARADHALYRAKRSGKNTVCIWGNENRKFPRYIFNGQVGLSADGCQLGTSQALAHDISLGGLKIESCQPMKINQEIEILLHEKEGNFGIKLLGSPVWIQKDPNTNGLYYLGLSFKIGSAEEEKALLDFIGNWATQEQEQANLSGMN